MVSGRRIAAQPNGRQRSHSATVDAGRMFDPTDPEWMTPEERLQEIAGLFARGVIRLRERSRLVVASSFRSDSETYGTCLASWPKTSPYRPPWLTRRENESAEIEA